MARKLTEAEKRRSELFVKTRSEFEGKGYKCSELTASVAEANLWGILLPLPIVILCMIPFFVNGDGSLLALDFPRMILFVVLMLVCTVLHEGIHGITWATASGSGFSTIEFGFIKEYLTPYCTNTKPMSRRAYITGLLMPGIVLGILPMILAVFMHSGLLMMLGAVMAFGAGGDFLIFVKILKHGKKYKDTQYVDHPSEVGTYVFEK